jgi:hypothetical protein
MHARIIFKQVDLNKETENRIALDLRITLLSKLEM